MTKPIDIGICGDARMAAEAISAHLTASAPACLATAKERVALALEDKQAWENGKTYLLKQALYYNIKVVFLR